MTGCVVCGRKYLAKYYKFKIYVNQQEFDSDCVFSWRVNKNHKTLHKTSCFFPEQPDKGMHISHPIHSDNCVLKFNGENVTCAKEFPAYTWRDYR